MNNVSTAEVNAQCDLAISGAALATAAALGTVDTVADAIKAKTDNLPEDPADQSVIIAAVSAVESAITTAHGTTDGLISVVDTVADGIKAVTDLFVTACTELSSVPGYTGTPLEMQQAVFQYMLKKKVANDNTGKEEMYKADGSSVLADADYSAGSGTFTRGDIS